MRPGGSSTRHHPNARRAKIPNPLPSDDKELHQLRCDFETKKCIGAYLRIYPDRPVGMLGFGPIEAKLISHVGKAATVQVGNDVTLSFDFERGVATYIESTPSTEGRGEVSCKDPRSVTE